MQCGPYQVVFLQHSLDHEAKEGKCFGFQFTFLKKSRHSYYFFLIFYRLKL